MKDELTASIIQQVPTLTPGQVSSLIAVFKNFCLAEVGDDSELKESYCKFKYKVFCDKHPGINSPAAYEAFKKDFKILEEDPYFDVLEGYAKAKNEIRARVMDL